MVMVKLICTLHIDNVSTYGEYLVKVNAYREAANKGPIIVGGQDMPPETAGMKRKDQYLPDKYNTKSTIEKFVVGGGKSKIEKDFDLK